MMGMTARQAELLDYIATYQAQHGIAPSTLEMQEKLGLSSKSGVVRLLNGLEERRLIRRIHKRARAIEIISPVGQNPARARRIVETVCSRLSAPVPPELIDRMVEDVVPLLR